MCVQLTSTPMHGKAACCGGEVDKINRLTPKTFTHQGTRLL